ncbi:hypothetical protein D3C80_1697510 [compost metagenome]
MRILGADYCISKICTTVRCVDTKTIGTIGGNFTTVHSQRAALYGRCTYRSIAMRCDLHVIGRQ